MFTLCIHCSAYLYAEKFYVYIHDSSNMYACLTPYIYGSAYLCILPITDIAQLSYVLSCYVVQFPHSWTAVFSNFRSSSRFI